jgi:raffinose/stachyose/melibiose transport system permease protein
VFLASIRHVFLILVLSLILQLPFALGLAVLLSQRIRGRAVFRLLFFLPYVLSEVITAVVWRLLLQPDGLADSSLGWIGLGGLSQEWLANPDVVLYTVFLVVTWKYFGFHMILYLAGLQQIPRELEEAAALDGATKWKTFRHVTLPLLGPTIRISVFLSMIGSLQLFDLVWVMTGGGPVNASNTMAVYMIDRGFERSRFGYGSAVAVIVFSLCFVIALAYQRFVLRRDVRGALTRMGAV